MKVLLICKTQPLKLKKLKQALKKYKDFKVECFKELPPIDNKSHSAYFYFEPSADKALHSTLKRLHRQGNLIVIVSEDPKIIKSYSDLFIFPNSIYLSTLLLLLTIFKRWEKRQEYFKGQSQKLKETNLQATGEKHSKMLSHQTERQSQKLKEELALASSTQNSLLPKNFPKCFPIDIAHKYIPHEYLGGDFFDIIQLTEQKLGILIADVSGHGAASALITAMLKSAFNYIAPTCFSPACLLKKINFEFSKNLHTDHYLTAFYCIFDFEQNSITFASAGHPPQLILKATGKTEVIVAKGFFLGIFEHSNYEEKTLSFLPGDRLVLFTDGLIECQNIRGQNWGRENLQALLEKKASLSNEELTKEVLYELLAHNGAERFADDLTLIILEYLPFL